MLEGELMGSRFSGLRPLFLLLATLMAGSLMERGKRRTKRLRRRVVAHCFLLEPVRIPKHAS